MTIEEFLQRRLVDLVRFAVLLCGNRATAEQLVDAAVERAFRDAAEVADESAAYARVRVWVVRGYLSEGMQLGRGPAADVDRPIVDAAEPDPDWDDLTARFVTSSKLQRAVAALRFFEGLDVPAIADAMGSTTDGIEQYLRRVSTDLNIGPEANSESDVRDLLELYGDDVDPDVGGQLARIVDRLPASSLEPELRPEALARFELARLEREAVERQRALRAERARQAQEEADRAAALEAERQRLEAEQVAAERAEAERLEAERLEAERAEAERLEAERLEAERLAAEQAEVARLEAERVEAESVEAERLEAERLAAEQAEAARLEAERVESERLEAERLEAERLAAEQAEAERLEAERLEAERVEAERLEAERLEAERLEAERVEAERLEAERLAAEQAEAARLEAERLAAEQAEVARAEAERLAAEQAEVARAEAERLAAERLEAERVEAERLEAERLAAEQAEAARLEAEQAEAERVEAERLEAERLAAERLEAERVEAERLEAERLAAEQAEAARLEAERLEAERKRAERERRQQAKAERRKQAREARETAKKQRAEHARLAREIAERAEAERRAVEANKAAAARGETLSDDVAPDAQTSTEPTESAAETVEVPPALDDGPPKTSTPAEQKPVKQKQVRRKPVADKLADRGRTKPGKGTRPGQFKATGADRSVRPATSVEQAPDEVVATTRRRLTIALSALLVLLTGGTIAVAAYDGSPSSAKGGNKLGATTLPSPVVSPLPGTKVVAEYDGRGSQMVSGQRYTPARGRQLALNVVCSGSGPVRIGSVSLANCTVPGAAVATRATDLRVSAPAGTSWRVAVTDQPAPGTDGALAYPADPLLTSTPPAGTVLAASSGSGNGTVVTAQASPRSARILLTCSGDGVRLTSDQASIDGRYATSCFRGWSYEFDLARVRLPATIRVRAAAGTTWRIVVLPG